MANKKLIEVALPLEKINNEAEREKHITQGHPAVLHLWWARRPLMAARAVLWSSLVDDPSSHPEKFPTEEEQNVERQRLFHILENLVVWENTHNETIIDAAKKEIFKYTGGAVPTILDPFAGGGTIPLEAQRLGLRAVAHDINPVAVLINKSMIDLPARFRGRAPINPDARKLIVPDGRWERSTGLAEDVRYYGKLLKDMAYSELERIYPEIQFGGKKYPIVSWIWTRTVKCPNPACGCRTPLVRSFNICKKKGQEAIIVPKIDGKHIVYSVKHGKNSSSGTVGRTGAKCLVCREPISLDYIRGEDVAHNGSDDLMCVIAEGAKGKLYLSPDSEQRNVVKGIERIELCSETPLPEQALGFRVQPYGFKCFEDLYTNRQLYMLDVFSEKLKAIALLIEKDAVDAGMEDDHISIRHGGSGALAYAQAVVTYLAFVIDKLADYNSTSCTWHVNNQQIAHTFGRQAIPMTWDYAEANPFSSSSGSFDSMLSSLTKCIDNFSSADIGGEAEQVDAQMDCGLRNVLISTDPPYYDNIGYADLSDYFYLWLRKNVGEIYPELFGTMMTPKLAELIANPFRNNNSMDEAKIFFEDGMLETCKKLYEYANDEFPVTIYYAYKQSETGDDKLDAGTVSTGWEAMLSAIVNAGFMITGTWPVRTEKSGRLRANASNALATSVVLVCRKRPKDSTQITRRDLVNVLRREIRPALSKLQLSNIAPVDLAQSAIGPGMAVYSRYKKVLESDGKVMTVRSALILINKEIDLFFNDQVGDMDAASRFCVDLYSQNAYNDIKFGDADILARAKGTSVASMANHGTIYAKAGIVHLIERDKLPEIVDRNERNIWMLTQQLTYAMETGGVEACANIISHMFGSNAERAKDLAYRLYTIAEQKKWTNEAYAYNSLVVAWSDIQSRAAALKDVEPKQMSLFDLDSTD